MFKEQEEIKNGGILVQTVLRALECLPNIACITYSPYSRHLPIEMEETRDLIPSGFTFSLTPDPSGHPFRQLITALHMSQHTGIHELRIEPLVADPGTVFTLDFFNFDEDGMAAAKFLFLHLERCSFSMILWVSHSLQFRKIVQNFTTLLQMSTNLQHLHLDFTSQTGTSKRIFARLGLQTTWSKLQSLSLEWVRADESEILDLMERHKTTLISAKFKDCCLLTGSWANVVDEAIHDTRITHFVLECVYEEIESQVNHWRDFAKERPEWIYEGRIVTTENGHRIFVEHNHAKKSVYDTRK